MAEHPWLRGAKKASFLAESLLSDIPPVNQRQELRRVETMTSIASGAPSWDFSFSVPPSPVARFASPSVASLTAAAAGSTNASPTVEVASHSFRSTSQSRASSRGPASPRISLSQWAERTSSGYFESLPPTPTEGTSGYGGPGFTGGFVWPSPRRSGSEAGRPRSGAAAPTAPSTTRVIRRGKSATFQDTDSSSGGFPSTNGLGAVFGAPVRNNGFSESPLRLATTLEPEDDGSDRSDQELPSTPTASASTASHSTAQSLCTPQPDSPTTSVSEKMLFSSRDSDGVLQMTADRARSRRASERKSERPNLTAPKPVSLNRPFLLDPLPLSRESRTPIGSDGGHGTSLGSDSGIGSGSASGSGTPMARSLSKGEKHGWLNFKHDRDKASKDKDKDKDKEHGFLGSLMARRASRKAK